MPELKDEPINTLEGLIRLYNLLGEKQENGLTSRIYQKKGLDPLNMDSIVSLHADIINGLRLVNNVDQKCGDEFYLYLEKRSSGFISVDGRASDIFLNARPEARSAAVLHEKMHDLEEEIHLNWGDNQEALGVLAEFLFTRGEDRLGYFWSLYYNSFNEDAGDQHVTAWRLIRPLFQDEDNGKSLEDRYGAILKKKKEMTEEEKIALLKKVVAECKPDQTKEPD